MTNDLIFIRDILYELKLKYGVSVDLYEPVKGKSNLTTGKKDIQYNKYSIKKAIHVPAGFQTLAQYNAAYIKNVSKSFAYGAYVDQDLRNLLIDSQDIPKTVEIKPDWVVVIDHKKFEVWKINQTEGNYAYLMNLKRIEGTRPEEIQTPGVRQTIRFTQTAIGVLT